MSERFDTTDADQRDEGLTAAAHAVRRGELVVLPTDTVYGLGADAFEATAVAALLAAKGRGREMPPPVLISAITTLDALADQIPDWARALADAHWPGPLTLVLRQQQSLHWDLGETHGTVGVRMPDHDVALELLQRTGPLAVSSANLSGQPAATTAAEAESMLGDSVAVFLDAGPSAGGQASTIIDCTADRPGFLRVGALGEQTIWETLRAAGHFPEDDADEAGTGTGGTDGDGEPQPGA